MDKTFMRDKRDKELGVIVARRAYSGFIFDPFFLDIAFLRFGYSVRFQIFRMFWYIESPGKLIGDLTLFQL